MARASFSLSGKPFSARSMAGLQHLLEAHRAPAVEQEVPGIDDAGDAAGQQAVALRQLAAVVLPVPLDGGQLGRARLGVDRDDLLGLRVVEQDHGVAADAVQREVGDRQHGLTGDGGVEGIAALLQNPPRGSVASGFIDDTAA